MRNYALNCAIANENISASPITILRNWLTRRAIMKLLKADPGTLAELGVTSEDMRVAISLPLSHDPRVALNDIATHRIRRAGRKITHPRASGEVFENQEPHADTCTAVPVREASFQHANAA